MNYELRAFFRFVRHCLVSRLSNEVSSHPQCTVISQNFDKNHEKNGRSKTSPKRWDWTKNWVAKVCDCKIFSIQFIYLKMCFLTFSFENKDSQREKRGGGKYSISDILWICLQRNAVIAEDNFFSHCSGDFFVAVTKYIFLGKGLSW